MDNKFTSIVIVIGLLTTMFSLSFWPLMPSWLILVWGIRHLVLFCLHLKPSSYLFDCCHLGFWQSTLFMFDRHRIVFRPPSCWLWAIAFLVSGGHHLGFGQLSFCFLWLSASLFLSFAIYVWAVFIQCIVLVNM